MCNTSVINPTQCTCSSGMANPRPSLSSPPFSLLLQLFRRLEAAFANSLLGTWIVMWMGTDGTFQAEFS